MITAVDTSVLISVFTAEPGFGEQAARALRLCIAQGRLVACEAVWAEVRHGFGDDATLIAAMADLGVGFDPMNRAAALAAGTTFRAYRARGGTRERVVADFLVGAHAATQADRLLARDRGFYRSYFRTLRVMDPSREPA